jgi:hypothetical protein
LPDGLLLLGPAPDDPQGSVFWEGDPMRISLAVPEELREPVGAFVDGEGLSIEVVGDGDGTVQVVRSDQRRQSDSQTLQAGGWISCLMARDMATKLRIDSRKMGKLLDLLDIKIRACELGCFE